MKTFPSTMAADDLTGPCVLKDQSFTKELESVWEPPPVSAGEPRNMGQALALTVATAVADALAAAGEPEAGSIAAIATARIVTNIVFIARALSASLSSHRLQTARVSRGTIRQRSGF